MKKILIVDDESEMLESLEKLFSLRDDFEIKTEQDYYRAKELLKNNKYDLLLTDLKLGKRNGIELCKYAKEISGQIKVIVITGYGTIESGVEAIKSGASDFIEKPFTSKRLFESIDKALTPAEQQGEYQEAGAKNFYGLIYKSKEMEEIINTVKRIANNDLNIVIQGESGTGKELIARALHDLSKRREAPFVPVNSGALPENLFESELFGYEKGAFTGATKSKPGLLEFADKGTFFLDEVTDLPLNVQAKLLRMIEYKKIRRIGGQEEIELDVRIIAATNQNIEEAVKSNKFRADLYYRLANFVIEIPPLRQRRDDILPIFKHFCNELCKRDSVPPKTFTREAEELIKSYDWPGNVREISNLINKLFIICPHEVITEKDINLPPINQQRGFIDGLEGLPYKYAKEKVLERFEVDYFKRLLNKHKGNISEAARECGLDRRTIHRIIKKYNFFIKKKS